MTEMGAWAFGAVDGTEWSGREQAFLYWQWENRGPPTGCVSAFGGVIELKARVVSAASSLAPGHIVP
jgi:hypothetical protein